MTECFTTLFYHLPDVHGTDPILARPGAPQARVGGVSLLPRSWTSWGRHWLWASSEGRSTDWGRPWRGHYWAGWGYSGESPLLTGGQTLLVAGEGGEGEGVAGPAAVQTGHGGPAALGGTDVTGGGDKALGLPPPWLEGGVPGHCPVLRPSVPRGAPAGLAPVVPVHRHPLTVHALEGDVEAITDAGEAKADARLTVDATDSISCLVSRNCRRRYFLWTQVEFWGPLDSYFPHHDGGEAMSGKVSSVTTQLTLQAADWWAPSRDLKLRDCWEKREKKGLITRGEDSWEECWCWWQVLAGFYLPVTRLTLTLLASIQLTGVGDITYW